MLYNRLTQTPGFEYLDELGLKRDRENPAELEAEKLCKKIRSNPEEA